MTRIASRLERLAQWAAILGVIALAFWAGVVQWVCT